MTVLKSLLNSRKVWIALVALAVKLAGHYAPQIPAEVVDSTVQLAMIVIAAITAEDVAAKIGAPRPPATPGPV